MPPDAVVEDRNPLIREAFFVEYLTIAWMVVEAIVGIGAGVAAGSLVVVAFGLDSLIELGSAGVLVWRLTVELRHGGTIAERAERRATRIAGALLFALAAYVVVSAAWKLWSHQGAEFSVPGIILSLLAIPAMYWLSQRKLRLADRLGSRALRADAVESITCGWLAFAVVVALLAQLAFGAWWVDPIASLAIVGFVIREGLEAWTGDEYVEEDL
jgi:divalent metal cation (Fe/Co/Zn/Cd) transporter